MGKKYVKKLKKIILETQSKVEQVQEGLTGVQNNYLSCRTEQAHNMQHGRQAQREVAILQEQLTENASNLQWIKHISLVAVALLAVLTIATTYNSFFPQTRSVELGGDDFGLIASVMESTSTNVDRLNQRIVYLESMVAGVTVGSGELLANFNGQDAQPWVQVTVLRGDTLLQLMARLGVEEDKLTDVLQKNNLHNPDILQPGQVLLLPLNDQ